MCSRVSDNEELTPGRPSFQDWDRVAKPRQDKRKGSLGVWGPPLDGNLVKEQSYPTWGTWQPETWRPGLKEPRCQSTLICIANMLSKDKRKTYRVLEA